MIILFCLEWFTSYHFLFTDVHVLRIVSLHIIFPTIVQWLLVYMYTNI